MNLSFYVKLISTLPHDDNGYFKVGKIYECLGTAGPMLLLVNEDGFFGEAYPKKCQYIKFPEAETK